MSNMRYLFEKTNLFKNISDNFDVYYDQFGGYKFKHDGKCCFYLNGALMMFRELKNV